MSVLELMNTRRTYRRFEQKPVPQQVIDAIVQALRLSSCGRNAQAIRLLVIDRPEAVQQVNTLVKWAAALPPELGTPKPDQRPTLFVAVVQKNGAAESTDAGLAISNMVLAAWEQGVGSCIMQAIDRPALSELFALPADEYLHSVIAFGYPTHQSRVGEVPADGSLKYYLDENNDYCVPKLPTEALWNRF